jgi:hypothetical protein
VQGCVPSYKADDVLELELVQNALLVPLNSKFIPKREALPQSILCAGVKHNTTRNIKYDLMVNK